MAQRSVEVLIPLAAGGGLGGAICEVRAGFSDRGAGGHRGLDPVIAPLADVRLQRAGQRALDAVRRLRARSGGLVPGLRLTRPRSPLSQLTPLDTTQGYGLGENTARSAELGLALALCVLERSRRNAVFFATGMLDPDTGDTAVPRGDGPVGPVSGLAQKFEAVGDWLERHRSGPWGRAVTFFVPRRTEDGAETTTAHAAEIDRLAARAAAVGVAVTVAPVASLAEGASQLGATGAPLDAREILAAGGLVAAAAVAALAAWTLVPLPFSATPMPFFLGPVETPVVLARDGDNRLLPQQDCRSAQNLLQVPFGDLIAVQYETRPTRWPAGLYNVVFVAIGSESSPKVFTAEQLSEQDRPRRAPGGGIGFGAAIEVGGRAEEMKLVALGRKLFGHDTEALSARLLEAIRDNPETRLNAQALVLEAAPGAYGEVPFRAVAMPPGGTLECDTAS